MEEEPTTLVAGSAGVGRLPQAISPTEQVLRVGHQIAEHPVPGVRTVRNHEELALGPRPGGKLREAQAMGLRIVVQDARGVGRGVLINNASGKDADPSAHRPRCGTFSSISARPSHGAPTEGKR